MNGTEIKNLKNREQSQQDHLREESERNCKFTAIVSFFKSSFLSFLIPLATMWRQYMGEKNNG